MARQFSRRANLERRGKYRSPVHRPGAVYTLGSGVVPSDAAAAYLFNRGVTTDGLYIQDEKNKGSSRDIQPGRAYDFDGVNDFVNSIPNPFPTQNFSATYWFKADTFITAYLIGVGRFYAIDGSGWTIDSNANNIRIRIGIGSGLSTNYTATYTFATNTWYHVAVTVDRAGDVTFYVNGYEVDNIDISGQAGNTGTDNLVIAKQGVGTGVFNGQMYDVRLYSGLLTADEVTSIYTFNAITKTPVVHYKCEDTDSLIAYDSSGNGNHGTKTNITASTFHVESTDVPYSFSNNVGYSAKENYVLSSGDLNDTGVWDIFTSVTVTPAADGYFEIEKIISGSSAALVQFDVTEEIGTYTIYIKIKAGTFTSAHIGILSSGWNSKGGRVLSGSALISNVGSIIFVSGLDSNESIIALEYDTTDVDEGLYIYPGSTGTGGQNNTIFVKEPQVVKGSIDDTYHGYIETTTSKIKGIIPRNESSTTLDALGNALQYTGVVPKDIVMKDSNCITLDGVNDYIACSVPFNASSSYSVTVKFKTSITTQALILDARDAGSDGFSLQINSGTTGRLSVLHNNSGGTVNTVRLYNDNQWYAVTITWDGATVIIDTGYEKIAGSAASAISTTTNMAIGSRNFTSPTAYYGGNIAYVKVVQDGLNVLEHNFSEGAGSVIYDVSGNGNHSTALNTTASGLWGATQNINHYNVKYGHSLYMSDFSDADYYSASIHAFNGTSIAIRLKFIANISAIQQTIATNGFVAPWAVDLSTSGIISIRYRDETTTVVTQNLTTAVEDGQYVDITIDIRGVDNTIVVTDNVDGSLSETFTGLSVIETASYTGTFYIGRYASTGKACDRVAVEYVSVSLNDTLTHEWHLTRSLNDQVGSKNLTQTGTVNKLRISWASPSTVTNLPLTNPAGSKFNNPETTLDFRGQTPSAPWVSKNYLGYGDFDGTAYVDISTVASQMSKVSDFSGSVTFRVNGTVGGALIIVHSVVSSADRFAIQTNTSPDIVTVGVYNGTSYASASTAIVADTDYALTWSYNSLGHSMSATLNGVAMLGTSNPSLTSTAGARIGNMTSAPNFFIGRISDFRIDSGSSYPLKKNTLDTSGNNNHGLNVNVAFPTISLPTAYNFGDPLPAGMSKETTAVSENKFIIEGV